MSGLALAFAVARWWWRRAPARAPDTLAEAALVAGLAVFVVVPSWVFQLYLLTNWPVSVSGIAVADWALALWAWWAARIPAAAADTPQPSAWATLCSSRAVWLVGAGAAALWSLRHGGPLSPWSCAQEAAAIATGRAGEAVGLLRGNVGDAQLGGAGLLAGAAARGLPSHALHGLTGAALALGGWLLGRSATGSNVGGWVGLGVLAASPCALTAPLADENTLTLAILAALLPLTLARDAPPLGLGALLGLAFTVRHPLAVAVPAFAALVWHQRGFWRGAAPLLLGASATSALEHAHHVLAFGSIFAFETHAQVPPQPYRLFGMAFSARGLMNWPLHDALVRTPHNPWPMWLGWPIHFVAAHGLLLTGLCGAGALGLWQNRPRQAYFWLAWVVPLALGLFVQEGWDFPNKMGVGLVLLPVLAPLAAAGVVALQRRPSRSWALGGACGVALLCGLGGWAATSWRAAADPRYGHVRHTPVVAVPAWTNAEALRQAPAGFLPDFNLLWRHSPPWSGAFASLAQASVTWGWPATDLAVPGPPTQWQLNLDTSPFAAGPLASQASGPPALDLRQPGTHFVADLAAPWQPGGLAVWAAADPTLAVIRLEPADLHRQIGPTGQQFPDRCKFLATLAPNVAGSACADLHELGNGLGTLRVHTPGPRLSVVLTVNDAANLHILWRFWREGAATGRDGPWVYWHN